MNSLNSEDYLHIFTFLSFNDIINYGLVCKQISYLMNEYLNKEVKKEVKKIKEKFNNLEEYDEIDTELLRKIKYLNNGHLGLENILIDKLKLNTGDIIIRWENNKIDNKIDVYIVNNKKKKELWYKKHKPKLHRPWMDKYILHRNNNPSLIEWYSNGNKLKEIWYKNGNTHRTDGPANREWHKNGKIHLEYWKIDGILHREKGPAYIKWYENGIKEKETWNIINKKQIENYNTSYEGFTIDRGLPPSELHKEDGPAYIELYNNGQKKTEIWYKNNQKYRKEGPAFMEWYENGNKKSEIWYKNNHIYRKDGPAEMLYKLSSIIN